MDINLIDKIENCIINLNDRQQSIARNLVIDSKYDIYVGTGDTLYIKDISSNTSYNFVTYVKSKCNC